MVLTPPFPVRGEPVRGRRSRRIRNRYRLVRALIELFAQLQRVVGR